MRDDLLGYYERELVFLRRMGAEFADKYPKVIGLPFHCLTRADLVRKDPSIIDVMQRAGLHSVTMSIESGMSRSAA